MGIFFTGKSKYDIYTNHNLTKHKNRGGISFNPEKIDWDYDYQYDYFNKPFGVSIELYPIILEGISCETVLIKEYGTDEERL